MAWSCTHVAHRTQLLQSADNHIQFNGRVFRNDRGELTDADLGAMIRTYAELVHPNRPNNTPLPDG